jgi:S-methyl-5-thioribose-1-phosphate isomerase
VNIKGKPYRTIWAAPDGWSVEIIDQTRLPHELAIVSLRTVEDAARAIKTMQVRGAPLIGATAAYGVCLALRADASDEALDGAIAFLAEQRPTAINLRWALEEMGRAVRNLPRQRRLAAAYARAAEICEADVATNRRIGEHGLKAIVDAAQRKRPGERVNVLTHCNAGWLACVDVGTATAPIYAAHDGGIPLHVWVDETRPRNQGAALTAYELGAHGVPHTIVVDNAGGHLMQRGLVDLCIVGTDRVTANGEQDRHLPQGAGGQGQRRAVLRRPAALHHRLDACLRRRHPHRGAGRRGGAGDDGAHQGRQGGARRDRGPRQPGPQRCFRRDAGAARHGAHHRARHRGRFARGSGIALSRARGVS